MGRDLAGEFFRQKRIAVVGATDRREKWGYKIYRYLRDRGGHAVYPVHPAVETIEGAKVYRKLEEISPPVDAVNLVVNPSIGIEVLQSCKALGIKHVWAQPGADSDELARFCAENGIDYVEGCVLVDGPGYPALTG